MTLHSMTRPTMFTNNFCACQYFPFTNIRFIRSLLVEFSTSFFQVLTCFNGCAAAMDAWLGSRLRWFLTMEFGENGHFASAFGSGNDVGLTSSSSWLGCPMSTVIRVTLTALLLRCPWQQRFFDIQTSANLRKFVLSFVSSNSLKTRMPVIPFPSERVFNSATFMPVLIPLKFLKFAFEKLYSRIPLIRPPSESHWCGRIRGMVAREGFI